MIRNKVPHMLTRHAKFLSSFVLIYGLTHLRNLANQYCQITFCINTVNSIGYLVTMKILVKSLQMSICCAHDPLNVKYYWLFFLGRCTYKNFHLKVFFNFFIYLLSHSCLNFKDSKFEVSYLSNFSKKDNL